jgi:hypothetical protein
MKEQSRESLMQLWQDAKTREVSGGEDPAKE